MEFAGTYCLQLYDEGPLQKMLSVAELMTAFQIGIDDYAQSPSNFFSLLAGGPTLEIISNVGESKFLDKPYPGFPLVRHVFENEGAEKLGFILPIAEQCLQFEDFCRHLSSEDVYWPDLPLGENSSADKPRFWKSILHHPSIDARDLAKELYKANCNPNDKRPESQIAREFLQVGDDPTLEKKAKRLLSRIRKYEDRATT